jgi:hypothetical protein
MLLIRIPWRVDMSVVRWSLGALLLAALPALAQGRIVPIEEEPRHVLKFQNAHVRFFDVQLPPGYEGLWHTHLHDGVFVNIEASATTAQDLGAAPASRPPRIVGETYFINYTKKPRAHRVNNSGTTPYRVTDTEIHQGCGGFIPFPDGIGQTLVVENDRVRVTRLMLGPGERIELHPPCGMLVAVTEGELAFEAGGPQDRVSTDPAGFKWRDSYRPVTLINVGSTVFHGVDILVK